jgi:hypothetical protein
MLQESKIDFSKKNIRVFNFCKLLILISSKSLRLDRRIRMRDPKKVITDQDPRGHEGKEHKH